MIILHILYWLIFSYLLFYSLHFFWGHFTSLFYRPDSKLGAKDNHNSGRTNHASHITILIPAYKVDANFPKRLNVLLSNLKGLPHSIYVLFQHCEESIVKQSATVCPNYDIAAFNQVKGNPYHHALRYALDKIKQTQPSTTHVIVLDPDNLLDRNSYKRFLEYTNIDADVIQGRRLPDSISHSTNQFDAISERLNDIQFRRSKMVQNLYIELAGSGMMLKYNLFKKAADSLDTDAPGMDKNLLIQLIRLKPFLKMHYDERITIIDEKTSQADQLHRQRLRWFANQYFNAFRYGSLLIKLSLINRILAPADYAVTLTRPPRSIQFLLSVLIPFVEILLWFTNLISFPLFTLTVIPFLMGVLLFIFSNPDVIRPSGLPSLMLLAFRNSISALQSLHPKLKGTFISTRNK